MADLVKKTVVFLSILIAFQFIQPLSTNTHADTVSQNPNIILQSKIGIEFQSFPAEGIKAVTKDKLAYVTTGMSGLLTIDIKDSANFRQTTFLAFPEAVSLIGMLGNYIYLPVKNNIYLVDITDPVHPTNPVKIPIDFEKQPLSMAIDSKRLYLADERNIKIYSLENPSNPLLLTSFCFDNTDTSIKITDLDVLNGTAYIAVEEKGVWICNFSDTSKIEYKGRYDSPEGCCKEVEFIGKYAFLGIQNKNITEVLDISNIEKPKRKGILQSVRSVICTEGNKGYVVNNQGCLNIVDLSAYLLLADSKPATVEKKKDENQKIAYITIDDGPSRSATPMNLNTLKKYNVKATFFVLPRSGVDDLYKRIIDEGHVIGNHSYSHDYSYLYSSTESFKKDVLKTKDYIYKKFNYTTTVFRFPGGTMGRSKSSVKARADILAKLGYKYFDWDVSMADTDPNLKKYGNEETIANILANNIIKNTKGRKKLIILMHDSSGKTYSAKALPKIIEGLKKQGYVFDVLTNY